MNYAKWMEELNSVIGDCDVRYINLPGTHHSGCKDSGSAPNVYQYRDGGSIGEQLKIGIRAFDIRLGKKDPEGSSPWIMMHHNGDMPAGQEFSGALDAIGAFCAQHPREILVLALSRGENSTLENKYVGEVTSLVRERLGNKGYVFRNTQENKNLFNGTLTPNKMAGKGQVIISVSGDLNDLYQTDKELFWDDIVGGNYDPDIHKCGAWVSESDMNKINDHNINSTYNRSLKETKFYGTHCYAYAWGESIDFSAKEGNAHALIEKYKGYTQNHTEKNNRAMKGANIVWMDFVRREGDAPSVIATNKPEYLVTETER